MNERQSLPVAESLVFQIGDQVLFVPVLIDRSTIVDEGVGKPGLGEVAAPDVVIFNIGSPSQRSAWMSTRREVVPR